MDSSQLSYGDEVRLLPSLGSVRHNLNRVTLIAHFARSIGRDRSDSPSSRRFSYARPADDPLGATGFVAVVLTVLTLDDCTVQEAASPGDRTSPRLDTNRCDDSGAVWSAGRE